MKKPLNPNDIVLMQGTESTYKARVIQVRMHYQRPGEIAYLRLMHNGKKCWAHGMYFRKRLRSKK